MPTEPLLPIGAASTTEPESALWFGVDGMNRSFARSKSEGFFDEVGSRLIRDSCFCFRAIGRQGHHNRWGMTGSNIPRVSGRNSLAVISVASASTAGWAAMTRNVPSGILTRKVAVSSVFASKT